MFNLGHDVVPMISVNEYFDLILLTLLIIGLTFELPVLIFFLSLFASSRQNFFGRISVTQFWSLPLPRRSPRRPML